MRSQTIIRLDLPEVTRLIGLLESGPQQSDDSELYLKLVAAKERLLRSKGNAE